MPTLISSKPRKSATASSGTIKARRRDQHDVWKKNFPKQIVTKDDVLKAYLRGVRKGLDDVTKFLFEKMDESVATIAEDRNKIADYLKSNGYTPTRAFLNIRAWNKFQLLLVVPEEDFLKESFLSVYDLTFEIEEKRMGADVHLDIGFINGSLSEQDEKRLESDGFYLDWSF